MLTAQLRHTTARAAIALADRAPSVHNSQPWQWRIGPSSIHLSADLHRALPATDPDGRDPRVSCGAALHHLRVSLRAAGLGSRVHRLPDPAAPSHLAALEPFPSRPTDDDLALAAAIEGRRTDRRTFSTRPLPIEMLVDLGRAARDAGAWLELLDREAQRLAVTRLVEQSLVAQALTPGVAQETAQWTGRSRTAVEGVPAGNVPVRPEGLVPVRHFRGGQQLQTEREDDDFDGTVLAILATREDGSLDQLRAGEALSAVLLTATRLGLATDPISQPLEVPTTRAELRQSCLAGQGHPQLVLRLGWAPVGAAPVRATGRRPVDETVAELDRPWP